MVSRDTTQTYRAGSISWKTRTGGSFIAPRPLRSQRTSEVPMVAVQPRTLLRAGLLAALCLPFAAFAQTTPTTPQYRGIVTLPPGGGQAAAPLASSPPIPAAPAAAAAGSSTPAAPAQAAPQYPRDRNAATGQRRRRHSSGDAARIPHLAASRGLDPTAASCSRRRHGQRRDAACTGRAGRSHARAGDQWKADHSRHRHARH